MLHHHFIQILANMFTANMICEYFNFPQKIALNQIEFTKSWLFKRSKFA